MDPPVPSPVRLPVPPLSLSSTSIPPLPPSTSRFRLEGKSLFLTFPQCPVPKELAQERVVAKFQNQLIYYVVAAENHKDGTPHLHLLLEFKERFRSRKVDFFDFIGEKHGNYQVARNVRKCLEYVTKCNNYVSDGIDIKEVLAKRAGKTGLIAKMVHEGKTLKEIDAEDPGYVLNNKRKIEEYISFVSRTKKEEKLPWVPVPEEDIVDLDDESDKVIARWLNLNILRPRELKQKQLFIHGPPNMGKTTLIENLSKYLRVYMAPRDEDFYDAYEDGCYDLIVFDEFKNTKTMQFMNQILDGQQFFLKQKGRQVLKKDRLPVIVLSNYGLDKCYPKLYEACLLAPLMARLEIVEVKSFISVFG